MKVLLANFVKLRKHSGSYLIGRGYPWPVEVLLVEVNFHPIKRGPEAPFLVRLGSSLLCAKYIVVNKLVPSLTEKFLFFEKCNKMQDIE